MGGGSGNLGLEQQSALPKVTQPLSHGCAGIFSRFLFFFWFPHCGDDKYTICCYNSWSFDRIQSNAKDKKDACLTQAHFQVMFPGATFIVDAAL